MELLKTTDTGRAILLFQESITQIAEEFIHNVKGYFTGETIRTIAEMEDTLMPLAKGFVATVAAAYIEEIDEEVLADKAWRREAGYVVERRNDERQVLTELGELRFRRTYYKGREEYAYLVDRVVGLEAYTRISEGVSLSLCEAASEMSYAKSSERVTGGAVSRQTVLHKLRACKVESVPVDGRRKVAVLHVDADEAHVKLHKGKNSIVPLISVYEGIDKHGRRGRCREIFHVSEYGKRPDQLWEQALSEIERRYDLEGTKIYLHGDGASWIKTGLDWLPNSVYVLDKYHKNKAIFQMSAGFGEETRHKYADQLRWALAQEDRRFFKELTDSLLRQHPERAEKIQEAAAYLEGHMEAIFICQRDPEANNGGCTEPHVSHILASRLSNRPMAWSKQTLTRLAPILASEGALYEGTLYMDSHTPSAEDAHKPVPAKKPFVKTPFLPRPEALGNIIPISAGKSSSLRKALRAISFGPIFSPTTS